MGTDPVRWAHGGGVVFNLTPGTRKYVVLYSFCAQGYPSPEGHSPWQGWCSTEREICIDDPVGARRGQRILLRRWIWMRRSIQAYAKKARNRPLQLVSPIPPTAPNGTSPLCRSGLRPEGKPVWDSGARGGQRGRRRIQTHTGRQGDRMYSFCAQTDCADGQEPYAGVVFDQKGNLYGATVDGGSSDCTSTGCGVVFKLTPKGRR